MTLTTQVKDANPAATDSTVSRVGHLVRVAVMFLSFGFIFPHAMTEDKNITQSGSDKDPSVKKQ